MKRIIACRGGGKTSRLIRMSWETGEYIMCKNPHEVASRAEDMNMNIPFPLSYDEFINREYFGKGIKGFLIDDVDRFVQYMAREVPVKAVSMSIDD